jgi:hypothetical protein
MSSPIISADSHITEAPNTYTDYIDPKWRDQAPHLEDRGEAGDLFIIPGMKAPSRWAWWPYGCPRTTIPAGLDVTPTCRTQEMGP